MKKYFVILGCVQAFIAIGAIPAGVGFLIDISGVSMGTSVVLLKNSPFPNFMIPALFLLIVNGFGNAIAAFYSFKKKAVAGKLGLVLGLILCLWIIIQVRWIGFSSFMQPMFLFIGVIEVILSYIIIKKENKDE